MAGEFVENNIPPRKDCGDHETWGTPSNSYYYIFKGNAKKEDYPEDACTPWYHKTAQIDGLKINSCLLYTSPSPRDRQKSRMPSSA